jgi:hypothetical protein
MNRPCVLLLPLLLTASGCQLSSTLENAARKITLNTPEPIKVDMKITLDVIQHDAPGAKKEKDVEKAEDSEDLAAITRRKFNRQEEIQKLKNSRFVAETHQGLLVIREQPPGAYGNYVTETVEKENFDRKALMIEDARKQKRELHEIEKERYGANVKNAFAGEWIEIPDPERSGGFKTVQKQ